MRLNDLGNTPFRMRDLSSVYPDCVNLAMKANRLESTGEITRLKRGLYVVNPRLSLREIEPFLIANHLHGPSYVSMHTALRHYGLIPEAVYTVQSMTTGVARRYATGMGVFEYIHTGAEYYGIGVTIEESEGATYMIATPEKALCDLMVSTPNLNLRYRRGVREFLEEDLRLDTEELARMDTGIIRECAKVAKKSNMLGQLIKFINDERHI